jgi:hypothetical protein
MERLTASQFSTDAALGSSSPLDRTASPAFLPSMDIAPTGQTAKQCWHRMQRDASAITGRPPSPSLRALKAQSRTHCPQATQRAESSEKNSIPTLWAAPET